MSALAGRDRELAELAARVNLTRSGRSSALVVYGEAGIGKSALLDHSAERARVQVRRMVASEYEAELPYAGLQLLCGPLMDAAGGLPAPQRAPHAACSSSWRRPRAPASAPWPSRRSIISRQ